MRRPRPRPLLLLLALLAAPTSAVLVAPLSSCDQYCGNNLDATTVDDLVCTESSYAGSVFAGCVDCELHSKWVYKDTSRSLSDLHAMLCR